VSVGRWGGGGGDVEVVVGGVRRRQRGSPRVLGWKAVENDQVPAVPTSFVGKVGAGLGTFSDFPYKVGRRLTPSRARTAAHADLAQTSSEDI
jgi:hypothetical protein